MWRNEKMNLVQVTKLTKRVWNLMLKRRRQRKRVRYDFKCYDDYQIYDKNSNVQHVENNVENSDNTFVKRKSDHIETGTVQGNQGFSNMCSIFKSRDICDVKIDETLASNITDLFRYWMNEEQYSGNCKGLKVVKTN